MPRVALSAQGRRELEQELQHLEAERPTIAERIRQAREQGSDPTENLDLRDSADSLMRIEGAFTSCRRCWRRPNRSRPGRRPARARSWVRG